MGGFEGWTGNFMDAVGLGGRDEEGGRKNG